MRAFTLALVPFLLSGAAAFAWNTETDVYWAQGCDFHADDIGSARTSVQRCGPTCFSTAGCTHFSWTPYNGGTCWLKRSGSVTKASAISSSKQGIVCGIVRKPASEFCVKKRIKIFRFCINGDDDSGANGEHQIRFNGLKYYPLKADDCRQNDEGFCEWREGQCHNLPNANWETVDTAHSITVGTEEHDDWSENDSYSAALSAAEWYSPTCEPYEVRFSVSFKPNREKTVCWEASKTVTAERSNVQGELNAGVQSCSSWTQPAETYVWYMEVKPL